MDHYPGIQYFTLKKPMPGADVGTQVTILTADGREALLVHGTPEELDGAQLRNVSIEMHIDMAKDFPEWFQPVTTEEHLEIVKENTILYIMDKDSCDRETAKAKLVRMNEYHQSELS